MNNNEITNDIAAAPEIESIEIMELLGKGGMSLVYKARQKQLDRIVAVKVLSKMAVRGEDGIKRFQKEAKLTSTLDHPNIVKTISFGVSNDGQPYLVMEYLEGLSLADDLKQNGRLKLQKFKDVFLPTLSALNLAHQAGMIHRDIKPGNIMICRTDTGAETVKLVDFGIAKVFGEGESETQNLTKTGAVIGSPAYMSPEQCQGQTLDGRSDLYSMACVMYETLSGEPPFSGESSLDVMQKHSVEPPPTVSDLSCKIDIRKELANVTLWGLAKDPASRPQTASEFARKLNEVLERITLDKVPKLRNSAKTSFRSITQQPFTIALGLLCIIILCTVVFMLPHHQSQVHVHRKAADVLKAASFRKDEREYMRSLARLEKKYGSDNSKVVPCLEALIELYRQQGKRAQAEPLYKQLLAIKEKALGPNDLVLTPFLDGLARCYLAQGKWAQAEPLYKRSLAIKQKALGPNDPCLAITLQDVAEGLQQQARYADAEALYKRALAISEKNPGLQDPGLQNVLRQYASLLHKTHRDEEANVLEAQAKAIDNGQNRDAGDKQSSEESLRHSYIPDLIEVGPTNARQ